jgi:hypothetical protein
MKEIITLRGDRALWLRFAIKLKTEQREVWEVLSVMIKQYLNKRCNDGQRKTKEVL